MKPEALPALRERRTREGPDRVKAPRVPNTRVAVGQRFNPYKLFKGMFIPEAVCRYRGISLGAKMIYGRLCRFAGEDGDAYPSIDSIASEIGIGETQARQYLRELERSGFISCERRTGEKGGQTSNRYHFLWHEAFNGAVGKARKKPLEGVRKTEPSPLRISEPSPPRKTEPEDSHHQESPKKKPSDASGKERDSTLPKIERKKAETPKINSSNADDDETPVHAVVRPAFEDPRQEFLARIAERHAQVDAKYVLDAVSIELSERNLSLKEFLDFDARCTTKPQVIANPAGYYRDLVRRLNAQMEESAFEHRRKLNEEVNAFLAERQQEKSNEPRCPICHEVKGRGMVFSADRKSIEPCDCATVEFVAEFWEKESARRNRVIEAASGPESETHRIAS
jgi:hypothetical protein